MQRLSQDAEIFAGPPPTDDIDIHACANCTEQTKCRHDVWIDTCWSCGTQNLVYLATIPRHLDGLFAA